jgi:PAS domain S-box-containing protein
MSNTAPDSRMDLQELRRRAIERLRGRHGKLTDMPARDVETLVHELEVYHAELEVQNEELRRTQSELLAALERYQDLYDHAPVGYFTLDAEGKILQANQTAARLCGRDLHDFDGRRLETIAIHDDRDRLYLLLQSVVATSRPQAADFRIAQPEGESRWVHADISLLNSSAGAANGARLTLTDITARVQADEALRESNQELEEFNQAMIGRELRMIESKREINAVCAQLGQPPRYERDDESVQP